jgi:hypothetical protein
VALPNGDPTNDPLAGFGTPSGPAGNTGAGTDMGPAGGAPVDQGAAAAAAQADQDRRTRDYAQQQSLQDAIAHSSGLASGRASQDSTSPGYGVPAGGAVLPNGNPEQNYNDRLGGRGRPTDPVQGRSNPAIDPTTGQPWEKNTHEFYQGAYTAGKGVADKDGYFDERYMSERNIMDNARRGDPAALAKLEVMAMAGNGDAKNMLNDLGTKFGQSQIAADFVPAHNASINQELAGGAFLGNREARQNLADQRMNPQRDVLTVQQSNPDAYQMMTTISELGGRKVDFGPAGVSWVDTAGDAHRVAIGEIAQRLPELQQIAEAHRKTQG